MPLSSGFRKGFNVIPDDPIPTIRRYHTDPAFKAQADADRQAHYDAFYKRTSANIDRVMGPRK